MTKPWSEVESSPEYLALTGQKRFEAKKAYYNEVVLPRAQSSGLNNSQIEEASKQFFGGQLTEPTKKFTDRVYNKTTGQYEDKTITDQQIDEWSVKNPYIAALAEPVIQGSRKALETTSKVGLDVLGRINGKDFSSFQMKEAPMSKNRGTRLAQNLGTVVPLVAGSVISKRPYTTGAVFGAAEAKSAGDNEVLGAAKGAAIMKGYDLLGKIGATFGPTVLKEFIAARPNEQLKAWLKDVGVVKEFVNDSGVITDNFRRVLTTEGARKAGSIIAQTAGGAMPGVIAGNEEEATTGALIGAGLSLHGKAEPFKSNVEGLRDLAARVINEAVRPSIKRYSYGKDPGRGVARELSLRDKTVNSFQELAQFVKDSAQDVGKTISKIVSASHLQNRTADVTGVAKPFNDAINEAIQGGKNNEALVKRLINERDALLYHQTVDENGNIVNGEARNLSNLSPKEVWDLKSNKVGKNTKWTGNPSDDLVVNAAKKDAYDVLKTALEKQIPSIKPLNDRYGDLTSADIAITHRENLTKAHSKLGLYDRLSAVLGYAVGGHNIGGALAGVAINKAMASTAVKSRVAKWLWSASSAERQAMFREFPEFADATANNVDLNSPWGKRVVLDMSNARMALPAHQEPLKLTYQESQPLKEGEVAKGQGFTVTPFSTKEATQIWREFQLRNKTVPREYTAEADNYVKELWSDYYSSESGQAVNPIEFFRKFVDELGKKSSPNASYQSFKNSMATAGDETKRYFDEIVKDKPINFGNQSMLTGDKRFKVSTEQLEKNIEELYKKDAPQEEIDKLEIEHEKRILEEDLNITESDPNLAEDINSGSHLEEALINNYIDYLNPEKAAGGRTKKEIRDGFLGVVEEISNKPVLKSVTNEQAFLAAKDLYENKMKRIERIKSKPGIPDFKNTNEAIEFGKTANIDQVYKMVKQRQELLNKIKTIHAKEDPSDADMQEGLSLSFKAQFLREALESRQGKIKQLNNKGQLSILPDDLKESRLAKLIISTPQGAWTPDQLKGFLKGKVSHQEMDTLLTPDLMNKSKITKDDILKIAQENIPKIEIVVKGKNYFEKDLLDKGYKITFDRSTGEIDSIKLHGKEIDSYESIPQEDKILIDRLQSDGGRNPQGSETKFNRSELNVPGGTDYKEVLIKANDTAIQDEKTTLKIRLDELLQKKNWTPSERLEVQDLTKKIKNMPEPPAPKEPFRSGHWGEDNVIAHYRRDIRTTPDGKKVFFGQEFQSDWALEGRKQGFNDNMTGLKIMRANESDIIKAEHDLGSEIQEGWWILKADDGTIVNAHENKDLTKQEAFDVLAPQVRENLKEGVPNHPLLKNWLELDLKTALKDAVRNNADYFSWTTGQQQSDRYNLSKYVDEVKVTPIDKENSQYAVHGLKNGQIIIQKDPVSRDKLSEVVGKDLAEKITSEKLNPAPNKSYTYEDWKSYSGVDLEIGGGWAKNLYDKQIPSILKKLTGQDVIKIDTGGKYEFVDKYYLKRTVTIPQNADKNPNIKPRPAWFIMEKGIKDPIDLLYDENAAKERIKTLSSQNSDNQPAIELTPEFKSEVKSGKSKVNELFSILGLATAGSLLSGNAQAAQPSDDEAVKAIIGEVGPGGLLAMRWVAHVMKNRNQGVKGINGGRNPNVVNKRYTSKQLADAKKAWEMAKTKPDITRGSTNWWSDADLKIKSVRETADKMEFVAKVGGNNFYRPRKRGKK